MDRWMERYGSTTSRICGRVGRQTRGPALMIQCLSRNKDTYFCQIGVMARKAKRDWCDGKKGQTDLEVQRYSAGCTAAGVLGLEAIIQLA